ncbi:toprim domain-containing protein, partial [Flavobacteriales bacterium]|nr:toprim domain-containing protein [Flavobacteriales bacterium]
PKRKSEHVCVVQDIRDVIAIENTQSFYGKYHVLGGVISPMDGVGPNDLQIDSLVMKASKGEINEIILALPATMEGDTTNFYIYKKLKAFDVKVTTIAKGVSIGDDIQYADQLTLGRSIQNRTLFDQSLSI